MEQTEGSEPAEVPKKRWPLWAKILIGIGCLVVPFLIVVLGLLATLVVPNVMKKLYVANQTKAKADIVAIVNALDSFAIENEGRYPPTLLPLVTPDANGFTFLSIDHVPRDPWGREYEYFPPNPLRREFIVRSLGSDGVPGGSGEAQDLDNLVLQSGKL